MRSLRMPCGNKTKEHIPIGPLWRHHRHRLNDVEMLSLNVLLGNPRGVIDCYSVASRVQHLLIHRRANGLNRLLQCRRRAMDRRSLIGCACILEHPPFNDNPSRAGSTAEILTSFNVRSVP
eukprot:scaffold2477_cov66-Cylindrotheca_fusiformis.AAC.1